MQAYMFQVMTDLQGDIPFSEALNANGETQSPSLIHRTKFMTVLFHWLMKAFIPRRQ
jgi:hypothetical protein